MEVVSSYNDFRLKTAYMEMSGGYLHLFQGTMRIGSSIARREMPVQYQGTECSAIPRSVLVGALSNRTLVTFSL